MIDEKMLDTWTKARSVLKEGGFGVSDDIMELLRISGKTAV